MIIPRAVLMPYVNAAETPDFPVRVFAPDEREGDYLSRVAERLMTGDGSRATRLAEGSVQQKLLNDFLLHAFGEAARRGVELHARYEKVAWLDPKDARSDLERALVKPEGAVALWRERSYELLVEGVWQSGQFDRVVFTERDGVRRAILSDFKTNRRRAGETPEAFAARMRETYAGQMGTYRTALSALTKIPPERIVLQLLLVETGSVV